MGIIRKYKIKHSFLADFSNSNSFTYGRTDETRKCNAFKYFNFKEQSWRRIENAYLVNGLHGFDGTFEQLFVTMLLKSICFILMQRSMVFLRSGCWFVAARLWRKNLGMLNNVILGVYSDYQKKTRRMACGTAVLKPHAFYIILNMLRNLAAQQPCFWRQMICWLFQFKLRAMWLHLVFYFLILSLKSHNFDD